MADDDDAWDTLAREKASEVKAPVAGVNKEMLRAALKLNPALRDNLNTEAAMAQIVGANRSPERPVAATPSKDIAEVLPAIRADHDAEHKRLNDEISRLQAELKALSGASRQRVCSALLKIDPTLNGPQTGVMLTREKSFLDRVGFTVAWFIDQKSKHKM